METSLTPPQRRSRFVELHNRTTTFVMPNPWDVGSAKLLAGAGFEALATTSAGFAWSLGRHDQQVTRDELVEHVRALAAATDLPLNVDSERCYADDLAGSRRPSASCTTPGCGMFDRGLRPRDRRHRPDRHRRRTRRCRSEAAHVDGDPMVLTARCENLLYGLGDLDDTIARLVAYRDAGADCVYAPGLNTVDQIRAVRDAVARPSNVLAMPNGPSVAEIAAAGARRVSTGGSLASTAYGAAMIGARELLEEGTSTYLHIRLKPADRASLG